MEVSKETEEKYLNALTELRLVLKWQPKVALLKYCIEKGLSKNSATEMSKGGIVKNVGGRGMSARWEWNTIEPNLHMAKELIKRTNNVSNDAMIKTRAKRGRYTKKTIVEKEGFKIKKSETRLFFGIIKLKTLFYYEKVVL